MKNSELDFLSSKTAKKLSEEYFEIHFLQKKKKILKGIIKVQQAPYKDTYTI